MQSDETIAAIATPPGRGGVGIIRIAGPAAANVAHALLGDVPQPRRAELRPFLDGNGQPLDSGIALWFPAPHSFTGDDILELQAHGGPVVLDMLLHAVLAAGARLAAPGEFSLRAFLNGKLDLTQAEAIADLIDADSVQAARSALRSLQGEFSRRVEGVLEGLTALRMYVEAAIDFPEEEIDFLAEGEVSEQLRELQLQLEALLAGTQQGILLREGMTVVIAGQPNAGKSSLLNALAGSDTAIVTDIPGTTRDLLREQIAIDGMPLHIIDTAGLRESTDPVEQEGIRRAWAAIEAADRVLLLLDDRHGVGKAEEAIRARLPSHLPITLVHNKIDLSGHPVGLFEGPFGPTLYMSAHTHAGLDLLRRHLKEAMGFEGAVEGNFIARRRHLEALRQTQHHLQQGLEQIELYRAGELLAEELRLAQERLGEITGRFTSDDLLGRIFTEFCIGK